MGIFSQILGAQPKFKGQWATGPLLVSGLQIFFQVWWAEVAHGAKNDGSFSEMMGHSIQTNHS